MTTLGVDAVIFDCDGTLIDVQGLRDYVEGRDTDYDEFHHRVTTAPPVRWVVSETRRWFFSSPMPQIVIVTARQEKYRRATEAWLRDNEVQYHELMMRTNGDGRPDYDVKRDALWKLQSEGYTVVHAYDDNPETVKLWVEHGIATTIVPGWGHE